MNNHEEIRQKIREAIFKIDKEKKINEYDLLFKEKHSWEHSKKTLRSDLISLLKHIEEDEYKEGIEKIEDVISSLKRWKSKIQKKLNNGN